MPASRGSGIRAIGTQPNYKLWLEGTTIEAVTAVCFDGNIGGLAGFAANRVQ